MAGWHHRLDGREFGWTPGVGDGQGGLACCHSWGCKESDTTERLNNWLTCYQFCTFKNPIFSTQFYLGVWLLAWLPCPSFDSHFSPPGHLYLLPLPSLFYPLWWISLGFLSCGEHLGNWLLARSVSLLLTPPLLLLVTSISFLSLLFSM